MKAALQSKQTIVRIVLAIGIIAGALVVAHYLTENVSLQNFVAQFGYSGLFVIALVNSFNAIAPVPTVTLVPGLLEAGFNAVLTILVITLGMTVGDAVSYFVGNTARRLTSLSQRAPGRIREWIERARERHPLGPYVFLFLFASFAPIPNEVVVIPLSFMGYQLRFMLPIVFVGNTIFNTLSALGVIGIVSFF